MKPSQRDDLIRETHQALLGIKGTEDNGLIGDFKELKDVVIKQNGAITKNTLNVKWIRIIGGTFFTGSTLALLFKLLGVYW